VWGTLVHQNHAAGGENGSNMVRMFVSLCLASQKPSGWEFFVPAGTDLGVTPSVWEKSCEYAVQTCVGKILCFRNSYVSYSVRANCEKMQRR